MSDLSNLNQFIVYKASTYTENHGDAGKINPESVLGIVRAEDTGQAQDTASSVFPDISVFVLARDQAPEELIHAGEKCGYLNPSQAHRPGF
jgi:hypothetical protein